jgi:Tol biopolymer transport system component
MSGLLIRNFLSSLTALVLVVAGCSDPAMMAPVVAGVDVNGQPDWSPDGRMLAYVHTAQDVSEFPMGIQQLWTYEFSTGVSKYIGPGRTPCWSSSGQEIVFVEGEDIWVHDLVNATTSQLTNLGSSFHPRWDPTGDRILFRHRTRTSPESIWLLDPRTNDTQHLGIAAWTADWSPTGTEIVHSSEDERQLSIRKLDGSIVRELVDVAPDRLRYPRWSRAGDRIAFFRFGEGSLSIQFVTSQGVLLDEVIPDAQRATWSPDGSQLVYERVDGVSRTIDLWIYDWDSNESSHLGVGTDAARGGVRIGGQP